MFRFFSKKGQNTVEYAIVFALVIAAVMAMQAYVRRGLQRGYKWQLDAALNRNGTPTLGEEALQYEPYYLHSYTISSTHYTGDDVETLKSRGEYQQELGERTSTREGTELIGEIQ